MLYCATGNPAKLHEFRLAAPTVTIEVLPHFAALPACLENGATFEENAILKASHYGRHADGLLFADDSGLEVDALGGAPGVHSARFAGQGATDQQNNELLLEKMRGHQNRAARFVCVIALVDGSLADGPKLLSTFHGTAAGHILEALRGTNGFGYDPLFFYPRLGCSFGELSGEEKLAVSHRGLAFASMLRFLEEFS